MQKLLIALFVCATLAPAYGQASLPGGASARCNPLKQPGCPDYRMRTELLEPWHAPKADSLGVVSLKREYANTINQEITVFWFKSSYKRNDAGVESQSLEILHKLLASGKIYGDVVVARAYWNSGKELNVDSYIFIRAASASVWRRNRSGTFVNQIIEANV